MRGDQKRFGEVAKAIETYFEGLHQADSKLLAEVFHDEARYVNATDGDYMNLDMSTYFDAVDQRLSPADRGEERDGEIVSLSFGHDRMAFVIARSTMFARDYLDYLTLVQVDGTWKIIAKVFVYHPSSEVP